ncbi:MAG: hypothetical protein J6C38_02040 [Oscillospiraceae bacterium]|nr:hypothetical protein [Oscillospiraceae bacterium]
MKETQTNNSEVWRSIAFNYFNVVAETTLSIAVIGSIFAGDVKITYSFFFLPIVLSFAYMLPCLPIYLKENMTVKQVMVQRVVELIIIEAGTIFVAHLLIGERLGIVGYIAVGASVLIFDVLSYLTQWIYEKSKAEKINKIISNMRGKR